MIKEITKPEFECKIASKIGQFFTQTQGILANFIANYYVCNIGVAFSLFTPHKDSSADSNIKNSLSKLDLESTKTTSDFIDSKLDSKKLALLSTPNKLNKKQQAAIEFINNHSKTLLFGDTGSGKTEIYINMILKTIQNNKNVIFLMPEISLTPQMESRLKSVFGDLVCIWHSKISKAKKKEILANIHNFKIFIGARSALFLPIENIGLIIVDEEHDEAYKSNSSPRYNASHCCIYLANKQNIKLILGSATPSLNSYYNFKQNDEVFRLKGRYFDSKKTIIFDKSMESLSPSLVEKIRTTLQKNKQIIIFVPIRANFKTLFCINCGNSVKCKNCSINLSFHSKKNALICHYCGFSMPLLKSCPNCHNNEFGTLKIGTQEIAKKLSEIFSDKKIAIFDRDEVSTDNKLKKILNDFNNSKIDILVGTQMISKGHDYHNVALVAILGIDNLLNSGDFRSYERAISLFYQIAGRCGRKEDGEVFVQSLNKVFFKKFLNDYEDFLNFELEYRAGIYPPFVKFALIISQNKNDNKAKEILQNCKKIVESFKNIEIVGLNQAPIERINGLWRYFLLIRSKNKKNLLECLHLLKNRQVIIDIDPLQIL